MCGSGPCLLLLGNLSCVSLITMLEWGAGGRGGYTPSSCISCQCGVGPVVCGGMISSAMPRRLSVCEPSSRIRSVIGPMARISPVPAGTKWMGLFGVSIVA